jgi:hypothetical protein
MTGRFVTCHATPAQIHSAGELNEIKRPRAALVRTAAFLGPIRLRQQWVLAAS